MELLVLLFVGSDDKEEDRLDFGTTTLVPNNVIWTVDLQFVEADVGFLVEEDDDIDFVLAVFVLFVVVVLAS